MTISGEKIKKRRQELKLSRNALGRLVRVSRNTIYDWETLGNASFKKYGKVLSEALEVDINYLKTPLPETISTSIALGAKAEASVIREVTPPYSAAPREPAGRFDLSEAVGLAIKILESKTSYADALYLNILHFSRGIIGDDRVVILEKKCDDLIKRMEEMENSIKRLTEENRALKEWAGESAPFDLAAGSAAPTGTDDQET